MFTALKASRLVFLCSALFVASGFCSLNVYGVECESDEFKRLTRDASISKVFGNLEDELYQNLSTVVGSDWVEEHREALRTRDFKKTSEIEARIMFNTQDKILLPPIRKSEKLSSEPSIETLILTIRYLKASPHRFVIESFDAYKRFCQLEKTDDSVLMKLKKSWGLEFSGFNSFHAPIYVEGMRLSKSTLIRGFAIYLYESHRLFYGQLGIDKIPQSAIEQFVLDSLLVLNPKCESCRGLSLLSSHSPRAFEKLRQIAIELGPSGLYRRISHPRFEFDEAAQGQLSVKVESLLGQKFVKDQEVQLEFSVDRDGDIETNNPYGLRLVSIELIELSKSNHKVLD